MIKRLLIAIIITLSIPGWIVGGLLVNGGFWGFFAKFWPSLIGGIIFFGFTIIEISKETYHWVRHGTLKEYYKRSSETVTK